MKKTFKIIHIFIYVASYITVSCGNYKVEDSAPNTSVNKNTNENDDDVKINFFMYRGFDGSKFNTKNTRQSAANFIINEIKVWKKAVKNIKITDEDNNKKVLLNEGNNFFTVLFDLNEETLKFQTIVYNVLDSNKIERKYDVPADGSCWLWAIVTPYLLMVKNDDVGFKIRFQKLFDDKSLINLTHVQTLIKKYDLKNTGTNQLFFKDEIVKNIVKQSFRNKVADYIEMLWNKNAFWVTDNESSDEYSEKLRVDWWNTIMFKKHRNWVEYGKASFFDEIGSTVTELNAYIKEKKKISTWGGGETDYFAICDMLDSYITVFRNANQFFKRHIHVLFEQFTRNNNIKLFFTGNHYNFYLSEL